MFCRNHIQVPARHRCSVCGAPFCANCVVEIKGATYCAGCRDQATVMQEPQASLPEEPPPASRRCTEAGEALLYAIVGILCFGIIVEPIALIKAAAARRRLRCEPGLSGAQTVTAATVIAVVALGLWVLLSILALTTIWTHFET